MPNIIPFRSFKPTRLLVVETNCVENKAIIVSQKNGVLIIEGEASTKLTREDQALGALLEAFKEQNLTLPTHAIVVTSYAIPALLRLPIPEGKSLSYAQMHELVRWEMDDFSQELMLPANIGWLLIARGYITEEHRESILQNMQRDNTSSSRLPSRFGEIAIENGLVTREQVEECLAIQEHIQQLEDDIICGWSVDKTTVPQHKGLTACVLTYARLHSAWLKAFQQHNIRLEKIYPSAISAAALLEKQSAPLCVVNIDQEYVAVMKIEQGELTECVYERTCNNTITEDMAINLCQSVMTTLISDINIHGNHPRIAVLTHAIKQHFNCDVKTLTPPDHIKNINYNAMLGAATHMLNIAPALSTVSIAGDIPLPPFYKRAKTWGILSVLCIIGAIASHEYHHHMLLSEQQQEIDTLTEETNKVARTNELLEEKNSAYIKAKAERDALKREHHTATVEKEYIENIHTKRTDFIRQLPLAIARSISDGVMLDAIEEEEWNEFTLRGWGLHQHDIDDFQRQLSKEIGTWDMIIFESPSVARTGWNNAQGYAFSFVLKEKL